MKITACATEEYRRTPLASMGPLFGNNFTQSHYWTVYGRRDYYVLHVLLVHEPAFRRTSTSPSRLHTASSLVV
jgi:hypothetical protein